MLTWSFSLFQVEDCQIKLDSKKQDIEKLQEQEKALYTTFSAVLGENNKFESFLTRVFKKKIKRAKKKAQAQEGSDEESEDEDSDEDLSSSDEGDSDSDDLDDSVCPPGCDQALFDQVQYGSQIHRHFWVARRASCMAHACGRRTRMCLRVPLHPPSPASKSLVMFVFAPEA